MKILKEINLVNIDKDGKDHFKQRTGERLLTAEPVNNNLINLASKESGLSKEEILSRVNEEIRIRVQRNITRTAQISVQYAVIPVGIIYLEYKDKKEKFEYKSITIDKDGKKHVNIGHIYYIPVTNNVASTLMTSDAETPGEWKRQHSSKRKIPIEKIEYIPLPNTQINVNLESVIEEIKESKKEKPKEEIPTFNVNDLPYEIDSDYRPKRAGKQNMFKLKLFGGREFPIISALGGDDFQKDVKVKVNSPNEAEILSSKLTGKRNGLKPWEVKREGLFIIFKDCYTTLGFNKQGEFLGKKAVLATESKILNYIRLLEKLTRKRLILK